MNARFSVLLTLVIVFISTSPVCAQQDWPYPDDAPTKMTLNVGTASDRPIDISRFLLARGATNVQINKQGTHIAFVDNVTGIRQLWMMPSNGGQAQQLTFGNGMTFFNWHPDGEQLLYGADNNGDEREAFYLISREGKKERLVLASSAAYRDFGAFDHNGSRFSYASTERNGRDFDIYVYDFSAKKSTLVYQAEYGFSPQQWRPGPDQFLVTETVGEDGENLYLFDLKKRLMAPIFQPKMSATFSNFQWRGDGSGFYFLSNYQGEFNTLNDYDLRLSRSQEIISYQYDIEDLTLCNGGKSLLYSVNDNGFEMLTHFNLDGQNSNVIDTPRGTLGISCSAKNKASIRFNGHDSPGAIYVLDFAAPKPRLIRRPDMAGINTNNLTAPQVITFPARDGVQLQGLLYLPKHSKGKPPLVVDIHGGPTAQSKATWSPLTQYLVGRGIAVLDINVRGSTGFGKTYARLDNQENRLDSVRDLVDALAWLKQDGRVDADNAAAIGGSYGGYMVNAVMGAYPEAFKAGASFVGVADWVRALQTASPGLKASDRIEYGDISLPQWQTFYAENSPINTVNNIVAPMFFQHGVNDPRDPVTESDTMVEALRARGIPVKYLRMPDEGHSVRKLDNRVAFYRELADFLKSNLTSQ